MLVRNTCYMLKLIAISATEEERDDWISEIRGAKTLVPPTECDYWRCDAMAIAIRR